MDIIKCVLFRCNAPNGLGSVHRSDTVAASADTVVSTEVGHESVPGLIVKEAVMSTIMTAGDVGNKLSVGHAADHVCVIGKCEKKND